MEFIGIIPARYASTRFPGKPLVDIKGKSMIKRVFEQAKKALDVSGTRFHPNVRARHRRNIQSVEPDLARLPGQADRSSQSSKLPEAGTVPAPEKFSSVTNQPFLGVYPRRSRPTT